jgi:hypothetical protein
MRHFKMAEALLWGAGPERGPSCKSFDRSFSDFNRMLLIVNAVRTAAGWPAVTWQNIISPNNPLPSPNVIIFAQHLTSLRSRMNEALQALGASISGYTDADPQQHTIRAVHINELQSRAQ